MRRTSKLQGRITSLGVLTLNKSALSALLGKGSVDKKTFIILQEDKDGVVTLTPMSFGNIISCPLLIVPQHGSPRISVQALFNPNHKLYKKGSYVRLAERNGVYTLIPIPDEAVTSK
jgi:hypothetical protein